MLLSAEFPSGPRPPVLCFWTDPGSPTCTRSVYHISILPRGGGNLAAVLRALRPSELSRYRRCRTRRTGRRRAILLDLSPSSVLLLLQTYVCLFFSSLQHYCASCGCYSLRSSVACTTCAYSGRSQLLALFSMQTIIPAYETYSCSFVASLGKYRGSRSHPAPQFFRPVKRNFRMHWLQPAGSEWQREHIHSLLSHLCLHRPLLCTIQARNDNVAISLAKQSPGANDGREYAS